MTTTADELLPTNAGVFENAAALAISDTLPVPLRQIVDAAETPVAFLPFLAAHESVDLWFEDWTEARKREMIAEAMSLAARKGTRVGAERFLSYVDGVLLDVIAYPHPFVIGAAVIGHTPIGWPHHLAAYLIKITTEVPLSAFAVGTSALGAEHLHTADTERLRRGLVALRAAKAPDTEIQVDWAHMRVITADDALSVDGGHYVGEFVARRKL